jgi:hypothetical protein
MSYNWAEYPQVSNRSDITRGDKHKLTFSQPRYDNAGLEVHLQLPQILPVPPTPLANAPTTPKPRSLEGIAGFSKKTFYILVAVGIFIVLAAVGGSLGAHFAGKKLSASSQPGSPQLVSTQSVSPPNAATPVSSQPFAESVGTGPTIGSTSTTVSSQDTTKAPSTTSVGTPNPCATTSAFTSGLFWMGTINEDDISPTQWFQLYDLNSAQACCEQCFNLNAFGQSGQCNVWGYFPLPYGNGGNGRDSCAIVWGYDGADKDNTCPAGRPAIGLLKPTGRQTMYAFGTGAPGLCAGTIYTYTTVGQ